MTDISLVCKNYHLNINPVGGGIKEFYQIDAKGNRKDFVCGYSRDEDKSGSMGDVLFPFPGRVENSEYSFAGQKYHLSDLRIKDGHAIHGFAKWAEWEVLTQTDQSGTLRFEMQKDKYAGRGFPFDLSIQITYSLDDHGFTCQAEVENTGRTIAPFGLGFHPYFSINGAKVDDMSLQIPAQKMVEFAPNLKPTGEFIAIPEEFDFKLSQKIGHQIIDNCFTDLVFDEDGRARTVLAGDNGQITFWQDKNLPYLQLYSADTIGEQSQRKGLAIEAQTCTGFALNMPKMGLKVLRPGETFRASWGVQA